MVTITANTKLLCKTLKSVNVAVHGNSPNALSTACEITVTDGKATFAVPGAVFPLVCITKGTCKAIVTFIHFYSIILDNTKANTEITITNSTMQIGLVSIDAKTTFFETDKILRTIHLPINYTDEDLLRLSSEGYTKEELDFNNLSAKIQQAEENKKKKIAEEKAKAMSQVKHVEPSLLSRPPEEPVFAINSFSEHHLDVCCGNDDLRPVMHYIYCINGIAYATDASIFMAVSLKDICIDPVLIKHLEGYKIHREAFQFLKKYEYFYLQKPGIILLNERTIQVHLEKIDTKKPEGNFINSFQKIKKWIDEKPTQNLPIKSIKINMNYVDKICKVFNTSVTSRLTFFSNPSRIYFDFDCYKHSYCWITGIKDE